MTIRPVIGHMPDCPLLTQTNNHNIQVHLLHCSYRNYNNCLQFPVQSIAILIVYVLMDSIVAPRICCQAYKYNYCALKMSVF